MRTRLQWFGCITLLVVALALPIPALARNLLTDTGTGTLLSGWTYAGDAAGGVTPAPGPGFGASNPAICVTTASPGIATATAAVGGVTSGAFSPFFFLNRTIGPATVPPSIITVKFKVRFSRDASLSGHFIARMNIGSGFDANADSTEVHLLSITASRGPQLSSIGPVQTQITGYPGSYTVAQADFGLAAGTGTLTVVNQIIPDPALRAKILKNGIANLNFIVMDIASAASIHAACVDDITVDVVP
jgi:hypothetical protein